MRRPRTRTLLIVSWLGPGGLGSTFLLGESSQLAGSVVLENAYVRVTRNAAPCASARGPGCGDRVIVALSPVEVRASRSARKLTRGEILVFRTRESHTPPAGGDFLEVAIKPDHPRVESPPVRIAPENNAPLYDGRSFFVFEERLAPGETRPRHSHSQRVVVVLNDTRLQQWPDGAPELFRDQVPDTVRFNPPVVHVVKNVGQRPLRNVVIELKAAPAFRSSGR